MGTNHIKFQLDVVTCLEGIMVYLIYFFLRLRFATHEQLLIHKYPDNFPVFQQILSNTYDLRQYLGKLNIKFH